MRNFGALLGDVCLDYPSLVLFLMLVRTALMGLIGFLPTKANGAIGGVDYTPEERKRIAKQYVLLSVLGESNGRSREWTCPVCKIKNIDLLPDVEPGSSTESKSKGEQIILSFGYQKDQNTPEGTSSTSSINCGTMLILQILLERQLLR